jgi:hypothetical protein
MLEVAQLTCDAADAANDVRDSVLTPAPVSMETHDEIESPPTSSLPQLNKLVKKKENAIKAWLIAHENLSPTGVIALGMFVFLSFLIVAAAVWMGQSKIKEANRHLIGATEEVILGKTIDYPNTTSLLVTTSSIITSGLAASPSWEIVQVVCTARKLENGTAGNGMGIYALESLTEGFDIPSHQKVFKPGAHFFGFEYFQQEETTELNVTCLGALATDSEPFNTHDSDLFDEGHRLFNASGSSSNQFFFGGSKIRTSVSSLLIFCALAYKIPATLGHDAGLREILSIAPIIKADGATIAVRVETNPRQLHRESSLICIAVARSFEPHPHHGHGVKRTADEPFDQQFTNSALGGFGSRARVLMQQGILGMFGEDPMPSIDPSTDQVIVKAVLGSGWDSDDDGGGDDNGSGDGSEGSEGSGGEHPSLRDARNHNAGWSGSVPSNDDSSQLSLFDLGMQPPGFRSFVSLKYKLKVVATADSLFSSGANLQNRVSQQPQAYL